MFTAFLTAGIITRNRPAILPGATARVPMLYPLFGHSGWIGLFGPAFCLGAVFLLVRQGMTRKFGPWFAGGYALWVVAYIAATSLSLTDTWRRMATRILAL